MDGHQYKCYAILNSLGGLCMILNFLLLEHFGPLVTFALNSFFINYVTTNYSEASSVLLPDYLSFELFDQVPPKLKVETRFRKNELTPIDFEKNLHQIRIGLN